MKLINQIKRHEGLRLKPYKCTADKLTIGYGRNLEDRGITKAEAEYLLANDVNKVAQEIDDVLHFYRDIDDARQGVLVNMAFNLGTHGLLKFVKMLHAVEVGDYNEAAVQMLDSRWAKQVGSRANELAAQMKTGNWQV